MESRYANKNEVPIPSMIAQPGELLFPFEEIVHRCFKLGNSDHKITFMSPDDAPNTVIAAFTSKEKEQQLLIGFSIDQLKSTYGKWPSMPEDVFQYCDQPGEVPDLPWFEQRNKKLRIRHDNNLRDYVMPASALGPLTLSYLMSTRGMVNLTKTIVEGEDCIMRTAYMVECVFLGGEEPGAGFWIEYYYLIQEKLERYLSRKNIDLGKGLLPCRFSAKLKSAS